MPRLKRTEETIPAINPAVSIFATYPLDDLQVSCGLGDKCLTHQSMACRVRRPPERNP
jgi:hypothetical protein